MARTLAEHLRIRIAREGPIGVADYMAEALGHPRLGYYRTRDPLGRAGDFVTAPEVSQMFGELIGLWCAVTWRAMGAPDPFVLAELGPGRGTLMADGLRAGGRVPGFLAAARLHLVETSRPLRRLQRRALAAAGLACAPRWLDDIAGLADGPLIGVANEFLDALPVRQFERTAEGWRERLVDTGPDGSFRFVLSPPLEPPLTEAVAAAPVGAVAEVSPAALAVVGALAARIAAGGGAALFIDYGPAESAAGDTLQAVRGHAYHPVLEAPGEADLTAHVDFGAAARAARAAGARVHGPVSQGAFLEFLGLGARAEALLARATPVQAHAIRAARARLAGPAGMGVLFKALAVAHPDLPAPEGFA